MTHDIPCLDALPPLQRRLVLLELEVFPEELDVRRLASWLDTAPDDIAAARAAAWRTLGEEPARLAPRARAGGLLIPLTAEQAARCEGPWPAPDEDEVCATARRVVGAFR